MKKRLQGLLAGLIAGVLLTTGAVYAANTTTLEGVLMNGIRIVLDGEELEPKDANGNRVEPFIYNGTTYLPVRAIATALGKPVYWDGPEFTVYLGDMDGELEYPTVQLKDMVSIADEPDTGGYHCGLVDNYGNEYTYYFDDGNNGDDCLQYLLNMKYSRFKGTLYVAEGENRDGVGTIVIEADGKVIYRSPRMNKTSRPVDIDVDVTGYNDVSIQFSTDDLSICLGDAGFYQ